MTNNSGYKIAVNDPKKPLLNTDMCCSDSGLILIIKGTHIFNRIDTNRYNFCEMIIGNAL
jgi:hypothetical protein